VRKTHKSPKFAPVTDAAVMKLPHPARMVPTMEHFFGQLEELLDEEWPIVAKELSNEDIVLPEVVRRLTGEHHLRMFSELLMTSAGMPGGTEQGGPLGLIAYMRHRIKPIPHFLLDDELVRLLEHTDIADDIPLSMFNLPFKRFYVEMGQSRQVQCTIPNTLSGDHILEGAYVERGQHIDGEYIYLVLTGSPLGKKDAADDATLSMALPVSDLQRPIKDVIGDAYRRARATAVPYGLPLSPEDWTQEALKAVLLLVKALLYIGMPGTRRELHPERTLALKALRAIKSTAKRVKAQRKADRSYDYIQIGPQPEHLAAATGVAADRNVRTHWRRGHYRMQAHGPQFSLRKLIFLEPMLVGAHTEGSNLLVSSYKVV
jgi:hypothetical protein